MAHLTLEIEMKLTIAVDFDGVLHQYTSPWTGALDINDPPVPGAIEWLEAMALDPDVEVIIHSCRFAMEPEDSWYWEAVSVRDRQIALEEWLARYDFPRELFPEIAVWAYKGKPHATVYLDDRGLRFEGTFPTLDQLRALRTWNKPKPAQPLTEAEKMEALHQAELARVLTELDS